MIKPLLIIFWLMLINGDCFAQNKDQPLKGIFVALNRTTAEINSDYIESVKPDYSTNLKIGYLMERINKNGIVTETGVLLTKNGFNYELNNIYDDNSQSLLSYEERLTIYYLEVPFTFKKYFIINEKSSFFIKGGLGFNLLLYTEYISKLKNISKSESRSASFRYQIFDVVMGKPNTNAINFIDAKLLLVAGFSLISGEFLIQPQVGYGYGIIDITSATGKLENRELTIGFTVGKKLF